LLRFSADIRSVALVLSAAALSTSPFLLPAAHLHAPWWGLVILWGASQYVRTFAPYAQHNHGHLPVFHSPLLNTIYDALLTQVTGYPSAFWELHHNRGHHAHYLRPERDPARITDLKTGRTMSRGWYALRGQVTVPFSSAQIAIEERRRGRPAMLRKLAFELGLQIAITAALFVWNPWLTLAFFVIPNMLAGFHVWWESYVHHLNVPSTNVYDASVSVLGSRFNALNFNIGHHTAHHEKPTLHWSLLPLRTRAIAARIPPACFREDEGPGLSVTPVVP
jgi:beta-carotene hydroxylase